MRRPPNLRAAPPAFAFAVIGQARADGLDRPGGGKQRDRRPTDGLGTAQALDWRSARTLLNLSSGLQIGVKLDDCITEDNMSTNVSPDNLKVGATLVGVSETPDLALWKVIEDSTRRLSFDNYSHFVDYVLCGEPPLIPRVRKRLMR